MSSHCWQEEGETLPALTSSPAGTARQSSRCRSSWPTYSTRPPTAPSRTPTSPMGWRTNRTINHWRSVCHTQSPVYINLIRSVWPRPASQAPASRTRTRRAARSGRRREETGTSWTPRPTPPTRSLWSSPAPSVNSK